MLAGIKKCDTRGSGRDGRLENITTAQVRKVLGNCNIQDDPTKVKYSWGFKYLDTECACWDYKGSAKYNQFSTYGPAAIWKQLFPDNYVDEHR